MFLIENKYYIKKKSKIYSAIVENEKNLPRVNYLLRKSDNSVLLFPLILFCIILSGDRYYQNNMVNFKTSQNYTAVSDKKIKLELKEDKITLKENEVSKNEYQPDYAMLRIMKNSKAVGIYSNSKIKLDTNEDGIYEIFEKENSI